MDLRDLAQVAVETSTTVGLGAFDLEGVVTPFYAVAELVPDGVAVRYEIRHTGTDRNEFEIGTGLRVGSTVTRVAVVTSSNQTRSGSVTTSHPVSFSAGLKHVTVIVTAKEYIDAAIAAAVA